MKMTKMVPRAKSEKIFATKSFLASEVTFTADQYVEKIQELLQYLIPEIKWAQEPNGMVTIHYCEKLEREGYTLKIQDGKIEITYSDYSGVRNAFASLANMIRDDFSVYECDIHDYPKCSYRGIMLDIGRDVENPDKLKEDLILAAKSKMNYLHLNMHDDKGSGIRLKSLPECCYVQNAYSYEQVAQLVEWCDVLALEIIPGFDLPAHQPSLAAVFDEMVCVTGKEVPSKWCACAGSEKTYEVYEAVIEELTQLFPGKYFHVGGDELYIEDAPQRNLFCEWENCSRCKEYMLKNNISDRVDMYYHLMTRVHDMLQKRGKTMIMWSDQVDTNREVKLPRDIIFEFWRVAGVGRGPRENCSLNHQLQLGYQIINADYPNTYIDDERQMNSTRIQNWNIQEEPYCDEEWKDNIWGSELCVWNYPVKRRAYHAWVLPSAMVLMGDKLWNHDCLPYSDEYEAALTRTILGIKTPEGFNVFKAIGDVLPPRSDLKIYKDKVTISEEERNEILDTLDALRGNIRADVYKQCIEEGNANVQD